MSNLSIVALLPMKAHSERVSGKNFRDFCGKPLFRWMLDTLLRVPEIAKVVINTDARTQLAEAGLVEGRRIAIRDRAPDLYGDFVSMNRIIEDDIANVAADAYVMTHTTNPLLGAETVSAAIAGFLAARKDESADSLFSVNRFQANGMSAFPFAFLKEGRSEVLSVSEEAVTIVVKHGEMDEALPVQGRQQKELGDQPVIRRGALEIHSVGVHLPRQLAA